MLLVNLDGVDHRLKFEHGYIDVWNGDQIQRIPQWTIAKLFPLDEPEMAIEGCTELSPEDNPNKAIGKKIALTRLTDKLSKEHSKIVWDAVRQKYPKIRVSAPRIKSRTDWRRV